MIEENPIPSLVIRYRKLKARRDILDEEMTEIKKELRPAVEATGGKWQDRSGGYARINVRKPSVNYSGMAVDRLAKTWSESDDPIMQSCGKMLLSLRKSKAGYSYLQVK